MEETGEALREQGFSMIFFLYDWHTHARETGDHFHGFTHPRTAMENAKQYFELTEEEKDAIPASYVAADTGSAVNESGVCGHFCR